MIGGGPNQLNTCAGTSAQVVPGNQAAVMDKATRPTRTLMRLGRPRDEDHKIPNLPSPRQQS